MKSILTNKRNLKTCLGVTLSLSCVLTSCTPTVSHQHFYNEQITSNEYLAIPADCTHSATYYYSCKCGEKSNATFKYGDPLGHVFNQKVVDNKYIEHQADCTHPTSLFYSCKCGEKGTETFTVGSPLGHHYENQIIEDKYKASDADCTHSATYYYSCECGECSDITFNYGNPLGHNYVEKVIKDKYLCNPADCTHAATYYYSCICGEHSDITFNYGNPLGHTYDQKVADDNYLASEADCTHSATYYYSCKCGAAGTETFAFGLPFDHSYEHQVIDDKYKASDADCTHAATYYYSCKCGEHDNYTFEYGNPLDHTFDQKVIKDKYKCSDATCTKPAAYYYSCKCGAIGTETFENGSTLSHTYEQEMISDDYLHNIDEIVKLPTNEEEGTCKLICAECGKADERKISSIDTKKYIVVPYIESTGNEYIDTGVYPSKTLTTKIDLEINSGYDENYSIFGSKWSGDGYFLRVYNGGFRFSSCNQSHYISDVASKRSIIQTSPLGIKTGDSQLSDIAESTSGNDAQYTIQLFSAHDTWKGHFKLYGFDMYEDGKAIRSFVPTINVKNGQVGLLDIINNKFYSNQNNTGNFVLPEGYSSTIVKTPTNDQNGEILIKYPGNADGISIKTSIINPNKYQFVECIQSTGYEYIDTGLVTSFGDKVVANSDIQLLSLTRNQWSGGNYYLQLTPEYINHYNRTNIRQEYNLNDDGVQYIYDDGSLINSNGPYNLKLFDIRYGIFKLGDSDNGWWQGYFNKYQEARFFGGDITINGKQAGIYQPVLDVVNNEYGIYDFVSNRFIRNIGGGKLDTTHDYQISSFVNENDNKIVYSNTDAYTGKSEVLDECQFDSTRFDSTNYERIDYIESTGTQYINTNLIPDGNTGIDIGFKVNSTGDFGAFVFGAGGVDGYSNSFELYPWSDLWRFNFGDDYFSCPATSNYCSFSFRNNCASFSNSQTTKPFANGTAPTKSLTLFAINREWQTLSDGSCRIYYCKIYDSDTLVRDFIPAISKKDKEIGLYDLVEQKFYTNQGTNSFVTPTKKDSLIKYTKIDSLTIDDEEYLELQETYVEHYEVDGYSLDGKKVYPNYINGGYRLGYSYGIGNYSTEYVIKGLTSYVNGKALHKFIPVERDSDKAKGLYDKTRNVFLPLLNIYGQNVPDLFFQKTNVFNPTIAILNAKISAGVEDHYLFFTGHGFDIIDSYHEPEGEDTGVAVHRMPYTLYRNDYYENGECYHLYFLGLFGTDGNGEWISNFTLGNNESGFHEGFEAGADFVIERISQYIDDDIEHNKIIVTGYSRGAGVGSIVATKLMEDTNKFKKENLTGYFMACPNYSSRNVRYDNIFHINSPGDAVSIMPLNSWGFYREGVDIELSMDEETINKMSERLKYYQVVWMSVEPVGYTGFTSSVKIRTDRIGHFVTSEAARSPENVELFTKLFYSYNEGGEISQDDIMKVLLQLSPGGPIDELADTLAFLLELSGKVAVSHEAFTYLSWLEAMYE